MRIFLYEFITGGGLLGEPLPVSLLAEGRAMRDALTADFAAIDEVQVAVLQEVRLNETPPRGVDLVSVADAAEEAAAFGRLASSADWTVVIAPESQGWLLERARRVEAVGGRLLGPASRLIELASDKQRTAEHLAAAGVPTPPGGRLAAGEPLPRDFRYPAILKPCDGAGSQEIEWLADGAAARVPRTEPCRLETYCPGIAASVAVLGGPTRQLILPACEQRLSTDGRFSYLGGSTPLPAPLAARAARLAERVVAALDRPLGYWGVDLVLGAAADGSEDVVIEVNPRLTTSYVGLRAACRSNLAEAMLRIAQGEPGEVTFREEPVQFRADGGLD